MEKHGLHRQRVGVIGSDFGRVYCGYSHILPIRRGSPCGSVTSIRAAVRLCKAGSGRKGQNIRRHRRGGSAWRWVRVRRSGRLRRSAEGSPGSKKSKIFQKVSTGQQLIKTDFSRSRARIFSRAWLPSVLSDIFVRVGSRTREGLRNSTQKCETC